MFIARALPRYLSGPDHVGYPSSQDNDHTTGDDPEQISPEEAVEYVLPLLNGLAMDEG